MQSTCDNDKSVSTGCEKSLSRMDLVSYPAVTRVHARSLSIISTALILKVLTQLEAAVEAVDHQLKYLQYTPWQIEL